MATFVSRSAEETKAMGSRLARALPDGTVVAMTGELGAGKTTFVQGAAEGLGIRSGADSEGETEGVTSPTFVLVREHTGDTGRKLVHVDAHRLSGADEMQDLGSDDFLRCRGVAFVEWAERVEDALPEPRLALVFSHRAGGEREISVAGTGDGAEALVEKAERALAGDMEGQEA